MTSGPKHILGVIGFSGNGKTTLLSNLIPELIKRGKTVSTMKHTHHKFDMDKPGKDSYRHREAGAKEVLLTSNNRWVLLHELREDPAFDMETLIAKMSSVDILLIEGFKSHPYAKLEVHRPSTGKALLASKDDTIIGVATDEQIDGLATPQIDLNDVGQVADFIIAHISLDA
ncbi:molybdopterin-guanine dinucleotide biosynthesis protein B [Magnetovibrio sp. PR-2]|uniref:molybdopterin-guanine dinucleotide biosynthesis protein B n=1 Tax=Magnetovibrio sp. PR-2 TaxID=3120356 RepID=UPI002FCE560D